jgi:hypothetical protein
LASFRKYGNLTLKAYIWQVFESQEVEEIGKLNFLSLKLEKLLI